MTDMRQQVAELWDNLAPGVDMVLGWECVCGAVCTEEECSYCKRSFEQSEAEKQS